VPRLQAELEAELAQTTKFREPPPLTKPARGPLDFIMLQLSRLNWRIVFAMAAVAVFLILGAAVIRSRARSAQETPPDLGPGLYQSKADYVGDVLPLPATTNR
jgi:hypothetical protein